MSSQVTGGLTILSLSLRVVGMGWLLCEKTTAYAGACMTQVGIHINHQFMYVRTYSRLYTYIPYSGKIW